MKQLDKREIYLVDNSNTEVRLTLWGQQGFQISAVKDEVIGIKGATVREFNGMYCLFSRFCINFKLAENHHLKYIHN
jgi:replication factor A1